MKPLAI